MLLSEIKSNPEKIHEIKVTSYLPIVEKMIMIQGFDGEEERFYGIIDDCIKEKDGMYYVDYISKEISFVIAMVQRYTNIEFDDVEIHNTLYDFCITSGIWNIVLNGIPTDELYMVKNLLDNTLEQELKIKNSIEGILNRNLQAFIEKIPNEKSIKKLIAEIPKQINKIKPEQLGLIKDMVKQQNIK